jgi:hypothetical protein
MLLGRTPTIPVHATVDYPAVVDDEYITSDALWSQPAHKPSAIAFFGANAKLCLILKEILTHLYQPNTGDEATTMARVLSIESSLEHWLDNLPDYLAIKETGHDTLQEDVPCLKRQRNILQSRFVIPL